MLSYLFSFMNNLLSQQNLTLSMCLYVKGFTVHTVAALRNAHAFESAHPQSYVIAHMSFRGKLSPYKPNNR